MCPHHLSCEEYIKKPVINVSSGRTQICFYVLSWRLHVWTYSMHLSRKFWIHVVTTPCGWSSYKGRLRISIWCTLPELKSLSCYIKRIASRYLMHVVRTSVQNKTGMLYQLLLFVSLTTLVRFMPTRTRRTLQKCLKCCTETLASPGAQQYISSFLTRQRPDAKSSRPPCHPNIARTAKNCMSLVEIRSATPSLNKYVSFP